MCYVGMSGAVLGRELNVAFFALISFYIERIGTSLGLERAVLNP